MEDKELIKLSLKELVDKGVCPTCLDRRTNGGLYGDSSELEIYKDDDIECLFVPNPREKGHMIISSQIHYHDMSEAPDELNEKIIRYSKALMNIIKEVYKCERVYLCTMCDGLNNHYHVQLIPRYSYEEIGSKNFVKPRQKYIYDEEKVNKVRALVKEFSISEK